MQASCFDPHSLNPKSPTGNICCSLYQLPHTPRGPCLSSPGPQASPRVFRLSVLPLDHASSDATGGP